MLFSIESRVPFLDHVLVEAMLGLPEDDLYTYGIDKAPLREGLKDILPEKIYKRRTKLGFVSSDDVWMRMHHGQVKQRLTRAVENFPGILNHELLAEFDRYVAGHCTYDNIFFRVLALYAWANAFGLIGGKFPIRPAALRMCIGNVLDSLDIFARRRADPLARKLLISGPQRSGGS